MFPDIDEPLLEVIEIAGTLLFSGFLVKRNPEKQQQRDDRNCGGNDINKENRLQCGHRHQGRTQHWSYKHHNGL
ncbi:hypothetical protein D3C76_1441480 [compost metagenome]